MNTPCSALVDGKCKNGFPTTPACRATERIGRPYMMTVCMSEDWAVRLYPETGAPRVISQQNTTEGK